MSVPFSFPLKNSLKRRRFKDLKIQRKTKRQTHRSNVPAATPEEHYRRAIFIQYLDSLIVSLESRFSESNKTAFKGILLHPKILKQQTKENFLQTMKELAKFYQIDTLEAECRTWYDVWKGRDYEGKLIDLLSETEFFPAVQQIIIYYMTIPPTTCTVERSFSTLRRVKTWLRSTMGQERLSSLCLLSVHRDRLKDTLVNSAIDKFSQNKRNLQFAFGEK